LFQVVTIYFVPKPTTSMNQDVQEIKSGLYSKLGVWGVAKNSSLALEAKVACAIALYPS
jgi:hypothetical protein